MATRKLNGPLGGDYVTDGRGNAVLAFDDPITDDNRLGARLATAEGTLVTQGGRLAAVEGALPSIGPRHAVWTGTGDSAIWVDPETGDRVYNPGATIHFVGDLHVGLSGVSTRHDTAFADFAAINPFITHRVYVGDLVDSPGNAGQKTTALARLNSAGVRSRWDLVLGNHDIGGSYTGDTQMPYYGYPGGRHWTRDLPFCRLIGLTQQNIAHDPEWMTLESADLAYLTAALEGTDLPCVIVYHSPLYDTVTAGGPVNSLSPSFFAHPDAAIRAILNSHPNAYLWVSGHTHTPISDPRILTMVDVGDRAIVHLNCSAIGYVYGLTVGTSPLISPVVTFDAARVTVRWRDHAAGAWLSELNLPDLASASVSAGLMVLSPDGSERVSGAFTPTVPGGASIVAGIVGYTWDTPSGGLAIKAANSGIDGFEGGIALWFKKDTNSADYPLYVGAAGVPETFSLQTADAAASVILGHRGVGGVLTQLAVPKNTADGNWHLAVAGWSATTNKLYLSIDGSAYVSATPTAAFMAVMSDNFYISGGEGNTSNDGQFGPAFLTNRVITQEEITHLYARRAAWTLEMLD